MEYKQLEYIVMDGDKIVRNKVISHPNLYPNLTNNLRHHISNIIDRNRFWIIQNNVKIFNFLYKEAEKQVSNGSK
jgi:hypothetical protein